MENPQFEAVCTRLKQALKLRSDSALAEALGFTPQAFHKRRERGSMPREEIEELVRAHGLSLAWVMTGDGRMYEGDLSDDALQQLQAQLEAMHLHNAALELVRPLLAGIVRGNREQVEQAIRSAVEMTPDEADVLRAFRRADAATRAAMSTLARAVDDAVTARAAAGRRTRQVVHGDVGQQIAGDQTVHGPVTITTGGKRR